MGWRQICKIEKFGPNSDVSWICHGLSMNFCPWTSLVSASQARGRRGFDCWRFVHGRGRRGFDSWRFVHGPWFRGFSNAVVVHVHGLRGIAVDPEPWFGYVVSSFLWAWRGSSIIRMFVLRTYRPKVWYGMVPTCVGNADVPMMYHTDLCR